MCRSRNANRILRGVLGACLSAVVLLLGASAAWAHQSPADCTGNNLGLDLLKNKTQIVSGDTVHYTVKVRNDAAGACDITGANVTFTCPAADGSPTGASTACAIGANYAAGFPQTTACEVDCVVTVNNGVSSAQAKGEVHGTLHDTPLNDLDTADVVKFISVQVLFCGDGVINVPGETCDPPGSAAGGNGNQCRSNCTVCGDGHVDAGEQCDDGNGNNNDACRNDCTIPRCGDDIVDAQNNETCDPPGSPAGANGLTCRADCTVCGDGHMDTGEQCDDGNSNNLDGCRNNCVLPVCGDGIKDANEQCDDGNAIDNDQCRNNCTIPRCGDDIVDAQNNETCDPPGSPAGANGLTCRADCTVCGDGHMDTGEQCDDGNSNNLDGCRNNCVLPVCGDGIKDANEQCDDGNTIDNDQCRNNCTIPRCGDDIVDAQNNETCDPPGSPAGANGLTCRADCTVCGDGHMDTGEQCDDGNTNDNDGCRNTCVLPRCGDGIVDAGEQCDDGNAIDNDQCRNNCTIPRCGDSIVDAQNSETCDPPGSPAGPNGNTCRADCTVCGDGHMDNGEQCDDGNSNNLDGCRNTCVLPFCGDGIKDANEQCDDGNTIDNDGCRNNCTPPECGDGIVDAQFGESCDPPGSPAGANGLTCRADCTVCGDGHMDNGEQCDDGNSNNLDNCRNTCVLPRCGDGIVDSGEQCDDGNDVNGDGCNNDCTAPCSVVIEKTVAPDDGSGGGTACDGAPDGLFGESVTVDETSCVVYQICVKNTGQQVLDGNGVKVSDPVLGTVDFDFGTIAVGADPVCKLVPGFMTAPRCTGGSPAGTSCICGDVEGLNTARISSAVCGTTNTNACSQPGSDCEDTASVGCLAPGSCRMTGGHNYDVVDAEFDENGKIYTTGGQIGAPNETGCCDLPPKGKCVQGRCTGGLNGGQACLTNDNCPNDPGRNSHCPWGDWEHNHHSGPDDSGSVTSGSFAFHSGTAASPNEAFIKSVLCADPGWCVQARPAPFKQIFWEGTGVFHNAKTDKNKDVPLPIFAACGAKQPVPYSNKPGGTLHYYKAHVGDFGEPAGIRQKPADACVFDESCTSGEPNGVVEISRAGNVCPSALDNVCLIDAAPREKETLEHPLCQAQACSECPDLYEIEIHCTADPSSPVAYRVSHFIREGNFQLHPPVGDSCNPSCGDGVCDAGVTGTAETCETCSADCGACQ